MANVAQYLQRVKSERDYTVREMARFANLDQAQMGLWLNGANIGPKNIQKLVAAGYLTRDEAADALLGPIAGDAA